jgi:hypothetical protein
MKRENEFLVVLRDTIKIESNIVKIENFEGFIDFECLRKKLDTLITEWIRTEIE